MRAFEKEMSLVRLTQICYMISIDDSKNKTEVMRYIKLLKLATSNDQKLLRRKKIIIDSFMDLTVMIHLFYFYLIRDEDDFRTDVSFFLSRLNKNDFSLLIELLSKYPNPHLFFQNHKSYIEQSFQTIVLTDCKEFQ